MKENLQAQDKAQRQISQVNLRDYWRIIFTHKWVIVSGFIIIMTATMVYLQVKTPIYEASTTIMREASEVGASELLFAGRGVTFMSGPSIQRQQILLKSNLIVQEIQNQIIAQGLQITPGEIRRNISLSSVTSESDILRIKATADTPTKAMMLANLTSDVYINKMSKLKSSDLDKAQVFLSEQMTVVDDNLRDAEEALNAFRESSGIVSTYSSEGSSGLLKQLGNLYAELSRLQNEREYTKAKRDAAKQLLDEKKQEMASLENNNLVAQIESLRSMISSWQAELVRLRQTLTDKAQEVIDLKEKIAEAQSQLDVYFQDLKAQGVSIDPLSEWQNLSQEYVQLDIQLKGLEQNEELVKNRIQKFKEDHPKLISKEVELTRLERTARQLEQTYMLLTDKYEETRLLKQIKTAGYTVVDKATEPKSPVAPNKRLTITLGMLIGLMAGFGAAFFLEYMDNSLKLEGDIERYLGLPIVGIIPMIKPSHAELEAIEQNIKIPEETIVDDNGIEEKQLPVKVRKHGSDYKQSIANLLSRKITNLDSKSPVTESYRTLWTNIQFAKVDEKIETILVSSSAPGEGKTITVTNLGITMARMGVKTLLIDSDLRRPRLHRLFQVAREPGLSDLIIGGEDGELDPNHIVIPTEMENLYLLTSGKRPPNPAEMLGSEKMRQLIEKLKRDYDIIVFDTPPIVPVTDAALLASDLADTVLLVVRSGQTKREVAQRAQELLDKVDANIFGVVLNTVDYSKQYGSYYYYRYYYQYYYSHDSEEQ
ncbi:polysaccharide biosynthesis tyrosine autokinase [Candidatus Poribacteria bacterium]|nr:polysaccharide biosynthesis tyrosine autokinase [Candidatus Poribacteria bacterium]